MDFCGGSYTVQAVNADNQICKNFYPEANESGGGRSKMVLNPTPGLAKIITFLGAPRGQLEYNGRIFVVADTQLYELTQTGGGGLGVPITVTSTVRGTGLANDGLPASLVCSQTQLLIASGGSVYLLVLATNVFSQVAASNFTLASGPAPVKQVEFCDSFFLALIANSGTVCISNVFDASSWNLNGQIVVSVFPENIVGMKVDHRQVWLRGNKKTVVYFASGSLNVFDVVPGGFIEQGGASPFSCDKVDNSILWLGQDDKGNRIAWRAVGYNASRISTHATELAWQKYPKASDAVSYAYQKFGHSFWQILFPSANNGNGATWVYDVATSLWHERDFLNIVSGASMGHPSWNHAFWNDTHIVGDWRSSNLYQMDDSFLDNAGVPIVRVRRAPHISTELEVVKHTRFELDMETGLGPEPPLQTGGGAPTVLTLKDANGILWGVKVTDLGLLTSTSGVPGPFQTVFLNVGAATWQLGVTIAGLLTTTSVAFAANPTFITMTGPTSAWDLSVTALGLLQTTKNNQLFARGPLVWLRWSDDGGHTWSNAQSRDAGQAGQYKVRLRWARLGRARIRTYEITCSDPVPFRIVDAYVNGKPGYEPSKRLTKQYQEVA